MRGAILACAALAALTMAARGVQPSGTQGIEREVILEGSGPRRLPVDLPLLQGAQPFARLERVESEQSAHWRAVEGLADLRFIGEDGREVPYLLIYPRTSEPEWREGRILPTAVDPDRTSGFELDLGRLVRVDALRIDGIPPPFLKRLAVEGSGDRARWTVLAAEATLFDLPREALRQLTVTFPAGAYRYLRVVWNDTNSARVPLPAAARARVASMEAAPDLPRIDARIEPRPSEPGRSRYRLTLPAGGLPVVAVILDVPGGHVYRRATLTESALRGSVAEPREIGRAMLTRVVREGMTAEDLRIPVSRPQDTQLELAVEDENNPPLDVRRAWLELAELPWIYLDAPARRVTARYGLPDARAPRYDLEAARPSIDIGAIADARWGEPSRTVETGDHVPLRRPQPGPPIDTSTFAFERALSSAHGLAMVALDAAVLAHSRGVDGNFADLRIVDAGNRQIPYLLERLQAPLALDLSATPAGAAARELTSGEGRHLSLYALNVGYGNLPAASLVIGTPARLFTRDVRVGVERPPDRDHRETWFDELAAARWTHTAGDGEAASTTLRLPRIPDERLLLVVNEGDNSPLQLTGVRLLLPAYRLRFFPPEGPARLVYGDERHRAPQYDFQLLAGQLLGAEATEVQLGEERALGASGSGPAAPLLSGRTFWIFLSLAVLVLLALVVRLVTREV